jgi:hypothetical protein
MTSQAIGHRAHRTKEFRICRTLFMAPATATQSTKFSFGARHRALY